MQYIDSNGETWNIELHPKPIPTARLDVDYWHEDYDGAPDSHDHRCGNVASIADAKAEIEEYVYETTHEAAEWEQNPER